MDYYFRYIIALLHINLNFNYDRRIFHACYNVIIRVVFTSLLRSGIIYEINSALAKQFEFKLRIKEREG